VALIFAIFKTDFLNLAKYHSLKRSQLWQSFAKIWFWVHAFMHCKKRKIQLTPIKWVRSRVYNLLLQFNSIYKRCFLGKLPASIWPISDGFYSFPSGQKREKNALKVRKSSRKLLLRRLIASVMCSSALWLVSIIMSILHPGKYAGVVSTLEISKLERRYY